MKVKYIRKSNVSLTKNNIYDVISVEKGCYRIIDDTGEDYLFQPEDFEIIDDNIEQKTIHEKWEDGGITILPGITEEENELIKKALTQVVTERVEKVNALPDAPFTTSDSFNQKMQDIIKEHIE